MAFSNGHRNQSITSTSPSPQAACKWYRVVWQTHRLAKHAVDVVIGLLCPDRLCHLDIVVRKRVCRHVSPWMLHGLRRSEPQVSFRRKQLLQHVFTCVADAPWGIKDAIEQALQGLPVQHFSFGLHKRKLACRGVQQLRLYGVKKWTQYTIDYNRQTMAVTSLGNAKQCDRVLSFMLAIEFQTHTRLVSFQVSIRHLKMSSLQINCLAALGVNQGSMGLARCTAWRFMVAGI